MGHKTLAISAILLAIFCLARPLQAQVATAELGGIATDATGASIPGVKVVATNPDTGFVRETVTTPTGNYVITLLPPGNYTLSAEAAGFRRLVRLGITLQVNQRANVNLALEVGQLAETVEVTAAAPQLESQSSSLGTVVAERLVADLPLNGRNYAQLTILTPGVSGVGFGRPGSIMSGSGDDRRPGTDIWANGNDINANNFTLDGVDNNDRLLSLTVVHPTVESIREFKVQTSGYSADAGRSAGAQVDVITKSGTNELHGSLFEFLRNSAMDARSFFNVKGTPFPSMRYNQFGFSLGGPIMLPKVYDGRNRTFFFVNYEGFRRNELKTNVLTVPTAAMKVGNFSAEQKIYDPLSTRLNPGGSGYIRDQFPGNQIQAARFDVPAKRLVDGYPAPDNAAKINNFTSNMQQTTRWDMGGVRVDHQFSPADTFFARLDIQYVNTVVPNMLPAVQLDGLPKAVPLGNEMAGPYFQPSQLAAASWVHVFSPTLINDLRVGFSRLTTDADNEGSEPGLNLANKLGVPNANYHARQSVLPVVWMSDYTNSGQGRSMPILRIANTFQYLDNFTNIRGSHTLKFGGDIRRRQLSEFQNWRGNGAFTFNSAYTNLPGVGGTGNSIASMLLGYASLTAHDWLLVWPGMRGIESALYLADDWRVTRKLTLNIGMRWEYASPYSEVGNRWANFEPVTATVKIAGRDGVDIRAGVQRNFRDFAPRFGFAYSVLPRTVIRGGYGLFYNPGGLGYDALRLFRHVPFAPIYEVSTGDYFVGPRMSDGFPPAPGVDYESAKNPSGGVVAAYPDFKYTGYMQQYNLTVEHEITPWHLLLKGSYVGGLGRRLYHRFDDNQPIPGPGSVNSRRPFYNLRPNLTTVTRAASDGLSNYNALQLAVEKRLSHGLTAMVGYTWSHSIQGNMGAQDQRYRSISRGNSTFDMRHRMTISYTYQVPLQFQSPAPRFFLGGWQINNIANIQTGLSFTPSLRTATVNTGTASRPDRLGDGTLPASQRSLSRWFDVTAFGTPALYTYGNCGPNILFGPGRVNFDMSLFKDFRLKENMKFQFRAEGFNVFNTPQFGTPNASIGAAQAGVISSTVGTPRQIQLALRFQF